MAIVCYPQECSQLVLDFIKTSLELVAYKVIELSVIKSLIQTRSPLHRHMYTLFVSVRVYSLRAGNNRK